MKYGSHTVDLRFEVEFSDDGSDSEIIEVSLDGVALPKALAERIMMALSATHQTAIVDCAWGDVEPLDDAVEPLADAGFGFADRYYEAE